MNQTSPARPHHHRTHGFGIASHLLRGDGGMHPGTSGWCRRARGLRATAPQEPSQPLGDHAAIARGGEDLVVAETPGGHITEAAHGLAVNAGAMGLDAVFDHGEAVGVDQLVDRGHVSALGVIPSAGSDAPGESYKAANRVSPQRNTSPGPRQASGPRLEPPAMAALTPSWL
jgi:hypothetical protein